jgi:hypothetical protein
MIHGLEKFKNTNGIRIPKLPKQKEKFLQEKEVVDSNILPKTLKEQ